MTGENGRGVARTSPGWHRRPTPVVTDHCEDLLAAVYGLLARHRSLARDYERLAATLAAFHWVAFLGVLLIPHLPRQKSIARSKRLQ